MEIFEYCQQLRQPKSFLLPFQVAEIAQAHLVQQLRPAPKPASIPLKPGIQAALQGLSSCWALGAMGRLPWPRGELLQGKALGRFWGTVCLNSACSGLAPLLLPG